MSEIAPQPLLTVDELRARILNDTHALPHETLPLVACAGRVLAEDQLAERDVPAFDNSAMDGFGVVAASIRAPIDVAVVGSTLAGDSQIPRSIGAGEAVAVMTGAPIPAGVDAVVMREQCDESNLATGTVRINADAKVGQHIRKRGEDLRAGDVVAARGCRITPARLNAMLAAGRVWARVVRRPRVAIIASGNELREVGESYASHHVINSNAHAIAAAATLLGCEATVVGIARDTLEDHVEWMQAALDNRPDVVITIGGVSMGTHDFVRPALEKLGAQLLSWRVAMRPGKPIAVARVQNTHVFALPGNPVSALVAFELFVAPALRKMSGLTHVLPTTVTRTLAEAVHKPRGLEHYARGQLRGQDVVVLDKQGSHHISALADADVLVRLPQTSEHLDAGASVECIVLPSCRG